MADAVAGATPRPETGFRAPKADLSTGFPVVLADFSPLGRRSCAGGAALQHRFRLSTSLIGLVFDSVQRRGGPMSLTYRMNLLAAFVAFALVSAILIGAL
jgi:hypothetical protein